MSVDIEKLAVFDSRIVQSRPKFAVDKGALSLTNAPFSAIAQTASQHTYNIYVPSENVFCDRKVLWSSTVAMQFDVNLVGLPTVGDSIAVPGRDFALCALPLNQLCSTLSATINDTTTVINSQDVLREVLRLADYKKNRMCRTAPTMLDKFANYNDAFGTLANPNGGYDAMLDYDNQPNGAYPNLYFTKPDGVLFNANVSTASLRRPAYGSGSSAAKYALHKGVPVACEVFSPLIAYVADDIVQSGGNVWRAKIAVAASVTLPVAGANWEDLGSALTYPIFIKWRTTEPIVLSPFVFSDEYEWDTGLFGLNNIQLIMNLVSNPQRILRSCSRAGRQMPIANIAYNGNVGANGVFTDSVVNVQFLTPSLDVPLPPKSVVPYMEFPRYITSYTGTPIAAGDKGQLISQTITLPCIPDLLIIYAKPSSALASTDADYYIPLASKLDGTANPLSINFDNFSGLLSSVTTEQLFLMSQHNGLDMDYDTWLGQGRSAGGAYGAFGLDTSRQQGQTIPAVGSILVLKPGQDLTLQSGQAPSLVGNFTLQFNLMVKNTSDVPQTPVLYVITANSGFFESIRGSSRVIKGVLSEQDILSAPLAPMAVRCELNRMVGGFSFSALGNILSKARDIYNQTKPVVSAITGMLPEAGMLGKIKSGAQAVGYGTGGGTGGKKSLASRLM